MKVAPLSPLALRRRRFLVLAGSLAALFAAPVAHAATVTWTGANGTDWNVSGTPPWSNGTKPAAIDVALFDGVAGGTVVANAVADQTITSIQFGSATGSFTIGATNGNKLLLTSGGSITVNGTVGAGVTETVNAPLVIGSGSTGATYSLINNSANATATLVVAGAISGGTTGATTLTFNGGNTGNNTVSGVISNGASSALGINKIGVGKWVLTGANTYTGGTTISSGSLSVSSIGNQNATSSNLGGAYSTINLGGPGNTTGTLIYTGTGETTDRIINLAGTTGSGVIDQSGTGLLKFTSDLTATTTGNKALVLQGSTTGAGEFSGQIVDSTGGTTGLTKTGTGTWTVSNGNNSYTGRTSIGLASTAGGVLRVSTLANGGANSSIGASSSAASNILFTSSGTLQYTGGTVTTDRAFSLAVNTAATIDVTDVAANLTMAGNTGTLAANQSFTKIGAGTLTLTGVQTYGTATIVNGGTLRVDMNAGGALAATNTLTLGGGTLEIKGANNTASTQALGNFTLTPGTNNSIKLTSTGGSGGMALTLGSWTRLLTGSTLNIDLSSPNTTLTSQPVASTAIQSAASAIVTYATVTDSGGTGFATVVNNNVVRYTGAATLAANSDGSGTNFVTKVGDAAYSGNTLTLTAGQHRMASLELNTDGGSGILDLSGNVAGSSLATTFLVTGSNSANNFTIQNGQMGSSAGGSRELIIHQFAAGTLTISATVGFSTNTTVVTKDGSGTLVLTGVNPYTGTTTVNGGVLRADDGVGLPTGSLLTLNNGVFETGASFSRDLGTAVGDVQITGGTSGFSANGGTVTISLGGTGTETPLTWGSATFNPGTLVLNESTANNTLNFKNAIDLNGSTRTINVNAASANAATISGVISNNTGGSGALVKGGVGTLVLSANNTYNGATKVNAGKLIVSGSLSGTNTVSVASGATLASGATGGAITTSAVSGHAVEVTGTLSPGDTSLAPITLTLAAGTTLNFNAGSQLRLDVAGGSTSDTVIFGGSAGNWLSGSGNVTLALNGLVNEATSTYVVFQNVTTPGFTFANITGYDTANWKANFALVGSNYELSFVAIPEPGTFAALFGGLGMLVGLQRLRRRRI